MRLKLVLLFFLTILIPTVLLVYFSLLAVKGEKEILETNMSQKYRAMAGIVLGDIENSLEKIPEAVRNDPGTIDPILFNKTILFKDEVMIFDHKGRAVGGGGPREDFGIPTYVTKVGDLPYEIAVYERYPVILDRFTDVKKRVSEHLGIVGLSAVAILFGSLFTLAALRREWRRTEIKEEFISHLAHDLRGPLTSVRMFSEMLQSDRVPNEEKKKEYYQILSTESEKLTHLAHNILDFSRIEGRRKKYEMKTENLASLLAETVKRFESYLTPGGHRIALQIDESLPPVRIDAEAISQALLNLLFNAVKYSPAGSEIRIVLSREGKMAHLSVIDEGIGIPVEEQKKIFREYYRVSDPEVRNREGSGLGLTLVKYAVNAHRGRIHVKSELGKGSEFKIELPLG